MRWDCLRAWLAQSRQSLRYAQRLIFDGIVGLGKLIMNVQEHRLLVVESPVPEEQHPWKHSRRQREMSAGAWIAPSIWPLYPS